MTIFCVLAFLATSCSAASELSVGTPTTLSFFDEAATTTSHAEAPLDEAEVSQPAPTITTEPAEATTSIPTSAAVVTTTTRPVATSETSQLGPTIPVVRLFEQHCLAYENVTAIGAFTSLDDPVATQTYFVAQRNEWFALGAVATGEVADDVQVVVGYFDQLLTLLDQNDFDLLAVVVEASNLEASTGADEARIVVEQFGVVNCDSEPAVPEQATAAFYIGLLGSGEDRSTLADLLAAAEVFSLEGAQCFTDRATADMIHPLVGAPSTGPQETALADLLSLCQIDIGVSP